MRAKILGLFISVIWGLMIQGGWRDLNRPASQAGLTVRVLASPWISGVTWVVAASLN